jgi:PAS domain S-box-containing protein
LGSQSQTRLTRRERGIFLLSLAAICVVAALGVALGDRAAVVELLLIGPVIAAFGASSRHTAIVAGLALLASIPLGAASGSFGSGDHATAVIAVGLVGGLAVGFARLRSGRERDAARLSVQYRVARVLAEAGSLEDAAPEVLEAIGEPLGWEVGHLWEVPESGALRQVAAWTAPTVEAEEFERVTRELTLERGVGLPGRVWQSGATAWLTDVIAEDNNPRARAAATADLRGGMAFPVRADGAPAVVIEFFARGAREPEPDTIVLTEALGALIGEFVEAQRASAAVRASEADATQARDQLQAILSGVADAVTAQGADGRLLFANPAALELMGFDSTEALLAAPPEQVRRRFEILDEEGNPFPVERYPGRRALAGEGKSEAVMRLRMRDTGDEVWTNVKATPIHDADGRVVMAINVTEDITTHIRAERAQRFLSEASAVIGASLDPNEVLGRVARLAVPEIADWLFIDMPGDDGTLERVAAANGNPEQLERATRIHRDHPPSRDAPRGVASVLRTGRPELYPDLQELARENRGPSHFRLAREFGMRSAIVAPMVARGRTLGVLTLATEPDGRRFDARDLELAEELALRCAMAVDNARLFSERAYIARTLQQSLLPVELPHISGIETAARFRPTGQGSEVGGDFYDLFETGSHGWTIVIGDVCGKGPDAAAVTALARYTLRAAAMREEVPSRSLELLNEALLRQRTDRRFCTVAYAYLESGQDGTRLGFASGGHPLPLLLHADGTVEPVGEPGTLLGVVSDPRFADHSVPLDPGDTLLFYTDGVIEGRGASPVLDERRLAELLASRAGEGADAIAGVIEDAAVAAQGGSPHDDIAVLVLRVAD